MNLNFIVTLSLLWMASACSEAAMQDAQQSSPAFRKNNTVSDESQTSKDEVPPVQTSAVDSPLAQDPVAVPPVSISGSYLVCIQGQSVDCRVDSDTQTNIAVDPRYQLNFSYQGQAVSVSESQRAGWRWKLKPQTLLFGSIDVKMQLSLEGVAKSELRTAYEASPMQIGDGSQSIQPGCDGEIGAETQPFALEFIKTFKLETKESIVVDMVGVCGIVLANDAYLQVSNSNGDEAVKHFLPATNAPTDLKFVIPDLAAGEYTLRIHASDKYEIDDFYIRNLSVSVRAP